MDADAQLTLTNSTLAGNTAWQGGGIFNNGGDVDTLNSTISGNDAWFDGGGVWTTLNPADGFGAASIILTTITGNTSKNCGGDLGRFRTSGGVTANPVGSVFLQSSILAGNIENPLIRPGFGDDCVVGSFGGSGLHSGGGNVIGVLEDGIGACNYIPPVLFTDQTGTFAAPLDPRLGALTIFTEPTATHRPIPPLSPAIDGGASLRCTPTDQRGEPRNLDGDLDGRRVCDSGSVEVLPATDIDGVAASVEDAASAATAMRTAFGSPPAECRVFAQR